jgi:hypothetical protein
MQKCSGLTRAGPRVIPKVLTPSHAVPLRVYPTLGTRNEPPDLYPLDIGHTHWGLAVQDHQSVLVLFFRIDHPRLQILCTKFPKNALYQQVIPLPSPSPLLISTIRNKTHQKLQPRSLPGSCGCGNILPLNQIWTKSDVLQL